MALDALRNYVQLASGLTDLTLQRAKQAAQAVTDQAEPLKALSPDLAKKLTTDLATELFATSKNNRDLLIAVVRSEVERMLDRLGVATQDDLEAVDSRLRRLDSRIDELQSAAATPAKKATKRAPAKKSTAKRAPAKKAAVPSAPDAQADE
jgi:polyhydroxyalkanoate synthesis regulator phasin